MFRLSREIFLDDTGATTEAGIVMIALTSLAMIFLIIVRSDWVEDRLAEIVDQALNLKG